MKKNLNMFKGKFGLEKESIRIDKNGTISTKEHPSAFEFSNPFITKDFAESQIEMITPPMESIELAVNLLEDIQNVVLENLDGEYLWNQSNPPIIEDVTTIDIAKFSEDSSKERYRNYLSGKYGREKSIISGIHFNVSFDEELLKTLYDENKHTYSYTEFKNKEYLKVAKILLRDRWFLTYLTNASPIFHSTFFKDCVTISEEKENGDCEIKEMSSLRNSKCGYRNIRPLHLDYSSVSAYESSIESHISNGDIINSSEVYSPVRIKKNDAGDIAYIELRFIDINPFEDVGVSRFDLEYIHLFMINALLDNDFEFTEELQVRANFYQDIISRAKPKELELLKIRMYEIHEKVKENLIEFKIPYDSSRIFESVENRIENSDETYSKQLKEEYKHSSYSEFHLKEAQRIKQNIKNKPFIFHSYKGLELSSKVMIKAAIKKGIIFEVLDEESNFLRFIDPLTHKVQIVQQATKTNLDKYANVLAMESKLITKKLLNEYNLTVPDGETLKSIDEVSDLDLRRFNGKGIVIKPNSTNFGVGITIYPNGGSNDEIVEAIKYAFSKDNTVLIEPFISGKEYRFLIIGNEVVGVLHRMAANVVGDGEKSIRELVEIKNEHPYRGTGYLTPLEYIELGKIEEDFIAKSSYDFSSVPGLNEVVFLRENSNISTGGDSIDFTDQVHESYKSIALKAAHAMGVEITGVDIMIEDISIPANQDNYGILELNFNPAIHIHTYPMIGINRNPSEKVLELLFEEREN